MLMQVKILIAALVLSLAAVLVWFQEQQTKLEDIQNADINQLRYMANHPASYSR